MKILIEESVLRRWTELCEKGHGQTVSEELRTALDAAEKVEDQLATVTAERDELVAALKEITGYVADLGEEADAWIVDKCNDVLAKLGADKGGMK